MAQLTIGVGTVADDGTGDTIRVSFGKVNTNFTEVYAALAASQPLDAELTSIAGLTSAANKVPYYTGSGTAALADLTQSARAITALSWSAGLQVPSLTAAGTASLLTVGSASGNILNKAAGDALYQPLATNLTTWAGVAPGTGVATALAVNVGTAGAVVVLNGAGGTPSSLVLTNATGLPIAGGGTGSSTAATARIALGLAIGTDVQAFDADLTAVANSGVAAAWTAFTPTVTASVGAITSYTSSGAYLIIGKTLFVRILVTLTDAGTGAGVLTVSNMPGTATARQFIGGIEDAVSGHVVYGKTTGGDTNLSIKGYDNATRIATGARFQMTGAMEIS